MENTIIHATLVFDDVTIVRVSVGDEIVFEETKPTPPRPYQRPEVFVTFSYGP